MEGDHGHDHASEATSLVTVSSGLTRMLRTAGISITSGVTLGLTIGNISALLDKKQSQGIVKAFGIDDDGIEVQMIGAMMQVGCMLGSMVSFALCDSKGRRVCVALASAMLLMGALVSAAVANLWVIGTGRLLGGLGQGMACHSVPIIVAELASKHWRETLNSSFQTCINIGILSAYAANLAILELHEGYRYSLAISAPLAMAMFICALMAPESPRWLVLQDRKREAYQVLLRLRESKVEAVDELECICDEVEGNQEGSWKELLVHRRPVTVGLVVCALQVGTGIDIFTTYASRTFALCGWGDKDTEAQLLIGAILLAFTFVPMFTAERLGARNLLLFGGCGMTAAFTALGVAISHVDGGGVPSHPHNDAPPVEHSSSTAGYVALCAMLAIPLFFSCSWGPLAWVIPAEVFNGQIRAKAMSVATCLNWVADWVVVFTFLSLTKSIGYGATYYLYAAINAFAVAFVFFFVRDHRGLHLEEIQSLY